MSDDNESSNDETLAIIEQFKPAPTKSKGPRRRRSNLQNELLKNGKQKSDLSPEEVEKLRKKADAERKKRRRQEMTPEERQQFLKRENERKRLQRLKPSFDKNRSKEAQRKKEKRRAMTQEQRRAFQAKDALRKRLERLKKKLAKFKENGTELDNEQLLELTKLQEAPSSSQNAIINTTFKAKRGRPRKNKDSNIAISKSTKKESSVKKSKTVPKAAPVKDFRERLENCVFDLIYEPLLVDNKDELLKIVDPDESDLSTVKDKLDNVHSTILNKPIILQKVSKDKHEIMYNTPMKFFRSPEVNIDDILKAETPPLMLLDSNVSEYESEKISPESRLSEAFEDINEEIQLNDDILLEVREISDDIFTKSQEDMVLEVKEISDANILKSQEEIILKLNDISKDHMSKPKDEIILKVKEISNDNILNSEEPIILQLKDISEENISKPQDEIVLKVKQMIEDTHSNGEDRVLLETVNSGAAEIAVDTNVLDYPMIIVDEQGNEISSK